ncbi:MAG: hypothetical protein ACTHMY_09460 [Solirubrobacteraceae bacterium]
MPNPSEERPIPPPGSAEEALRRLEQRLDRASEAAERLMAEAAEAAAGISNPSVARPPDGDPGEPGKPPPAGWQIPEDARAGTAELDPFVALVQALRDLVPPELQRRLVAAIRELLLALRALIDWYLERLERRREQAVEVQDIPIL